MLSSVWQAILYFLSSGIDFDASSGQLGQVGQVGQSEQLAQLAQADLADSADDLDAVYEIYEIGLPLADNGVPIATTEVIQHQFGNSWGKPATVNYTPPALDFNAVTVTIDWIESGVQYDRLAHLYLNDVEIWRPSTPEPGTKSIHSNHTIDVSDYISLFQKPGKLVLELNNLLTDKLTGILNTTVTINYYEAPTVPSPPWYSDRPADNIQSIFGQAKYVSSAISSTLKKLPSNITKAVIEVHASGNGDEEFWYAEGSPSVPTRLVEIEVNGQTAGYVDPYPVIYTGAFQPKLWQPFVGTKAYEVPSSHIDITPFLPLLWAGNVDLSIKIGDSIGVDVPQSLSDWIISASLLSWETEGAAGIASAEGPISNATHAPVQLLFPSVRITNAKHSLNVTAELDFGLGLGVEEVKWSQEIKQNNMQLAKLKNDVYIITSTDVSNFTSGGLEPLSKAGHDYGTVLILGDEDITIARDYSLNLSDHTITVSQNASWGATVKTNGTDVVVKDKALSYKAHAISRNGTIVQLSAVEDALSLSDSCTSAFCLLQAHYSESQVIDQGRDQELDPMAEERKRRRLKKWVRDSSS